MHKIIFLPDKDKPESRMKQQEVDADLVRRSPTNLKEWFVKKETRRR